VGAHRKRCSRRDSEVALSVIVNVPVRVPPTAGSKKTPTEQLDPAAKLLPHAFNDAKSLGLVVTLAIVSVAVPVFVSVTDWGFPLVPMYWLGNLMLVGEMLAAEPGIVLTAKKNEEDHSSE
jgi:hypothetical protein